MLFESRFDPAKQAGEAERSEAITEEITGALDSVASLDEDRILRSYLGLISATLRTNYFSTAYGPVPYLVFKLDAQRGAGPAGAAPAVRDVRLLAPVRGRAPAVRQRRPRRPALVRPARGLPHRDPRPGQGAGGQELGHRAVRRQGRLRVQAAARSGRSRGLPGRGARLLPHVHLGDAGRDRQPGVRPGRAARAGGAARRGRPVPGRGRRQGHGDVLRHRERDRDQPRVLAGRRLRLGRLRGLRPQEDGHHGPRRVGVGQVPLPYAAAWTWIPTTSPSSASATCPATSSATGCCCRGTSSSSRPSTTGMSSWTPTPTRRPASPSGSGCSACLGRRGRTTTRR